MPTMFGHSLHRADLAALLALLVLLLWLFPFALLCWFLDSGRLQPPRQPDTAFAVWAGAALASWVLVGAWLGLQSRRAWIWRRRRNPRPSREIQRERQRIARTLHDAVGSQLVNASMLLDTSDRQQRQLHAVLEHCLLDLRLLVDSMDGDQCMLTDRLAILRHRLQPVLERRGIRWQWEVPHSHQPGLPAGEPAQHIAAIVQEALSNMLQHAQATELEVTLQQHQGEWHLRVRDDGVGLAQVPGASSAGKGLQGMADRAARAGAQLERVQGIDGRGMGVHVRWPVAGPRR
ncbi:sensor histidine kinase [Pantoea sp. 18069]|uniref:sensor histidine kinase n=1 Tax=Pantoea sp. 18069 TaxID=2681415 RepID=UPI001358C543|nr:ATP-binding protein [Pantoea sp. 18069]